MTEFSWQNGGEACGTSQARMSFAGCSVFFLGSFLGKPGPLWLISVKSLQSYNWGMCENSPCSLALDTIEIVRLLGSNFAHSAVSPMGLPSVLASPVSLSIPRQCLIASMVHLYANSSLSPVSCCLRGFPENFLEV